MIKFRHFVNGFTVRDFFCQTRYSKQRIPTQHFRILNFVQLTEVRLKYVRRIFSLVHSFQSNKIPFQIVQLNVKMAFISCILRISCSVKLWLAGCFFCCCCLTQIQTIASTIFGHSSSTRYDLQFNCNVFQYLMCQFWCVVEKLF